MTRRDIDGMRVPNVNDRREQESRVTGAQMANRAMGGRYTVQDKIGTGGMAIVYRGLDEVLGRTVAIKTMLPQYANDESFAARFKQEAQAAAALQSPYIVSVYDWGKDGDTYYIIMEYLRGTDLKSGIRKHGALDCRKVAQIGSEIAQALTVAHRHDIIHRDIKPQNIMVQPDGHIKVMDFGIARAKNSHLTTDNSVLGTAHYVSPEQTQGHNLGPTTDIYSLGIVMYEAATGKVPFDGDDAISVALKQVNEPPMPPSQINPRVDPALEAIILKCMQKRSTDRFQSAEELHRALRDYMAGRLQAVNNATSISSNVTQTARMNRTQTGITPVRRQRTGRISGETTGHYRTRSATEAELNRRHRRNVVIGIIATMVVLGGIVAAALFLAGHPASGIVPQLEGLTKEAAISQIEKDKFFTVSTPKEEFSSDYPAGIVIDQSPDAGNTARKGSAIDLVVSKGPEPAKSVTVPDLTGMGQDEAEQTLAALTLNPKVEDAVFSDQIEEHRVAAQDPAPGTSLKAGDTVVIRLSKGAEEVQIPYVVGWSQSEAVTELQDAGFNWEIIMQESGYSAGMVSDQSETGKAKRGTTITLTVSSGPSQVSVPNVVGKSESSAVNDLANAGFDVSTVSVSSSESAGSVVWQSVSGQASQGTTVELGISTGSERESSSSSSSSSGNSSSNSGSDSSGNSSGNSSSNGSSDSSSSSSSSTNSSGNSSSSESTSSESNSTN